ncbi:helix-turn-helix transcriptional regulator [Streptomyces sp. NBC_00878]|uniref:helix-turn-helix domain-containing protein n=1 Tax=Streptomyces sp. NBC_00878 TaxID=2975854 RepID=UPI002257BD06|nr:helix-turn-helix transcriptional regulator [Streptomyces sp. NBC_00878]MCX4904682.1 helix-turn-helix domain-containing protein [Streptomyces sp. NBC_00878]
MTGDWEPDPSDSLKTFGAFVQGLREHAGFTREEFARLVRFSVHTVTSIELGRRMPDSEFIERAEAALGNTGALRRAAKHLSRQPGLASWFRRWASLEGQAVSLCTYECRLVPGLLQSEAYVRAVCDNDIPPVPDDELEALVSARMERQKLLREKPRTTFDFVIEETLFVRRIGGVEVTRGLLDHVLAFCALRNVTLQIMPLASEHHACLAGPLQLLETPDGKWQAYAEGQESGRLITDRKEVSRLQMRYARLRSQALSPQDSVGLLERMRGAL